MLYLFYLRYILNITFVSLDGKQNCVSFSSIDLPMLVEGLRGSVELCTVSVQGNPVCQEPQLHSHLISVLPSLEEIDGENISSQHRENVCSPLLAICSVCVCCLHACISVCVSYTITYRCVCLLCVCICVCACMCVRLHKQATCLLWLCWSHRNVLRNQSWLHRVLCTSCASDSCQNKMP